MKNKKVLSFNCIPYLLMGAVVLFLLFPSERPFETFRPPPESSSMLTYPQSLPPKVQKTLLEVFPQARPWGKDEAPLLTFFTGGSGLWTKDVTALPLVGGSQRFFFVPLYYDVMVLQGPQGSPGVLPLAEGDLSGYSIEFPQNAMDFKAVWALLSLQKDGRILPYAPLDRISRLQTVERANTPRPGTIPLSWILRSEALREGQKINEGSVVYPKEGVLVFSVGLLLREELSAGQKALLARADLGEGVAKTPQEVLASLPPNVPVFWASEHLSDYLLLGNPLPMYDRLVLGRHWHVPQTAEEHQVVASLMIFAIVFFLSEVRRVVLRRGLQKSLYFMGALLLCWILLHVLKYTLSDETYGLIRILWYSYYFFILTLPVLSLSMAANVTSLEEFRRPLWLKAAAVVSGALIVLVLTNDAHQLVFRFLAQSPDLWRHQYERTVGYQIIAAWFMLTQFVTFWILFRNSLEVPNRRRRVLPLLVFLMGLLYNLFYNLSISFFRDIPLVLGMTFCTLAFWQTALWTGLVPNNRRYRRLFERSRLNMQILDKKGQVRYRTLGSHEMARPLGWAKGAAPYVVRHDQSLHWHTLIAGGTVLACEDISELRGLQAQLEEATAQLERENKMLRRQERIKSRKILLLEQNRISREVATALESCILEMKEMISHLPTKGPQRELAFACLRIRALYCKRRSELLVKSKSFAALPATEVLRIANELTLPLAPMVRMFGTGTGSFSLAFATRLYLSIYGVLILLCEGPLTQSTLRLFLQDDGATLWLTTQASQVPCRRIAQALKTHGWTGGEELKDLGEDRSLHLFLKKEDLS
ncbi:hypothetical protein ABB02_01596 [Clostridiaceae bacterium JG1575]|nr:hypothetical protein ABB02_01596 [Clostridiaceae bacterium JG1575]